MEKIHKRLFGAFIVAGFAALPLAAGAADVDLGGSATLAPTITATSEPSSPVMVTATDAQSGATLSSSGQVQSMDDFHAYARGALRNNSNLKEIDADANAVTVKYNEDGYVLGLFPVSMTSSATISADGNVTLAHPWYYFMTSSDTNNASLRSALSTEAAATFNQQASAASEGATSTARVDAALSANKAAQLLAGINLALGSALTISASGSAVY